MNHSQLAAIAGMYGLPVPDVVPEPWTGATSRVYPVGDVVIKVALDTPAAVGAVQVDVAMNPVARDVGVRTPELIAFDDSREILPVPFGIFRRVPEAWPLSRFFVADPIVAEAWRQVGRQLALVHSVPYGTSLPRSLREFRQTPEVDPRPWLDELGNRGVLPVEGGRWLHGLLDALAPIALAEIPLHLCHGDVNASNILLSGTSGSDVFLIDWAGAGWLDPVWDFVGVPLTVVPWLLEGHRSIASLPHDGTAEPRIFWCQAQTRLHAALSHGDRGRLHTDMTALRAFAAMQEWA